jgi:nucleoid-associated protein YgaU
MGEALHTQRPQPADLTPLHVFAAVLLGLTPGAHDARIAALADDARRRAAHALNAGRVSVEHEAALAYRLLYETLRPEAAALSLLSGPPRATAARDRVRLALLGLRHRQRATLVLEHAAGLPAAAVAFVLGVREREVPIIAAAATARVARLLGEPFDLAGSLRPRETPAALPPAPPAARLPRPVMQSWTAPPPPAIPPPPAKQNRPRVTKRALALMAAVAAIALALAPVSAKTSRRASTAAPQRTVTVVMPPVPRAEQHVLAVHARTTVVHRGDSLWAIAERELGDPMRWTQIWSMNRGRMMAHGERFLDADLIRPGWRLRLPYRGRA